MIGSTIDIIISVLLILGGIVIGVIFFWLYQDGKESRAGTQLEANSKKSNAGNAPPKTDYPRENVQKFMEFDKIEDDMIIQEKGNRFVMAIKCFKKEDIYMVTPTLGAVLNGIMVISCMLLYVMGAVWDYKCFLIP